MDLLTQTLSPRLSVNHLWHNSAKEWNDWIIHESFICLHERYSSQIAWGQWSKWRTTFQSWLHPGSECRRTSPHSSLHLLESGGRGKDTISIKTSKGLYAILTVLVKINHLSPQQGPIHWLRCIVKHTEPATVHTVPFYHPAPGLIHTWNTVMMAAGNVSKFVGV